MHFYSFRSNSTATRLLYRLIFLVCSSQLHLISSHFTQMQQASEQRAGRATRHMRTPRSGSLVCWSLSCCSLSYSPPSPGPYCLLFTALMCLTFKATRCAALARSRPSLQTLGFLGRRWLLVYRRLCQDHGNVELSSFIP